MKIGFDVSDLSTDRADGTTRYTRELALRLPVSGAKQDWLYFSPGDFALPELKNVTKILSPWPKYWTQARLPWDLYRYQPDVLFMPIQQIPYVRPRSTKTVAVVHDLAVHRYPQQFTRKDWLLLHIFSAYVAREADQIIAVSRATADDIAHYYGRTKNVSVVHHGVDHEQFRLPVGKERPRSWQKLHEAFPSLRQPYLLFIGQIQPRKNLVRLIEAFERLGDDSMQLVVAGGHGWLKEPIKERIASSPRKKDIVELGRVPDELLPGLYWHADVFVLPSLYEGFGMPILEAFACGCPVVTSNVSSLPEIAGDAAVLVDPLEAGSIADGIKQAQVEKEKLRAKGIKRATQFTWERAAQETLAVLTQSVRLHRL